MKRLVAQQRFMGFTTYSTRLMFDTPPKNLDIENQNKIHIDHGDVMGPFPTHAGGTSTRMLHRLYSGGRGGVWVWDLVWILVLGFGIGFGFGLWLGYVRVRVWDFGLSWGLGLDLGSGQGMLGFGI